MEIISKAVLSFFDLVEAEGRTLRDRAVVVMEGVVMIWFGATLILMALLAAGFSLYMLLNCWIGGPASAAIVAIVFAGCGFLVLAKGRDISRNGGGPAE